MLFVYIVFLTLFLLLSFSLLYAFKSQKPVVSQTYLSPKIQKNCYTYESLVYSKSAGDLMTLSYQSSKMLPILTLNQKQSSLYAF
jgi:hypothetical protein